jgi:hypothetical protein
MANTYTNHSCTVCCEQTSHIMLQLQDKIICSDTVAWEGGEPEISPAKFELVTGVWIHLWASDNYSRLLTFMANWESQNYHQKLCTLSVTCHLVPWTYNILLIKIEAYKAHAYGSTLLWIKYVYFDPQSILNDWMTLIPLSKKHINLTQWETKLEWAKSNLHSSWRIGEAKSLAMLSNHDLS